MLKARNKKISLLIVLAMLMTMFVGVGTASAATTITSLSAPLIPTDSVQVPIISTEGSCDTKS